MRQPCVLASAALFLTSSTPDALWSAPPLRSPAAGRGRLCPDPEPRLRSPTVARSPCRPRRSASCSSRDPDSKRVDPPSHPRGARATRGRHGSALPDRPESGSSGWGRRGRIHRPEDRPPHVDDADGGPSPLAGDLLDLAGRREQHGAAGACHRVDAHSPRVAPGTADEPGWPSRCSNSAPRMAAARHRRTPGPAARRAIARPSTRKNGTASPPRSAAAAGRSCSRAAIPPARWASRRTSSTCATGRVAAASRRSARSRRRGLRCRIAGIEALAEMRAADAAWSRAARRRREPDRRRHPARAARAVDQLPAARRCWPPTSAPGRGRRRCSRLPVRDASSSRLAVGRRGARWSSGRRSRRWSPRPASASLGRAGWLATRSDPAAARCWSAGSPRCALVLGRRHRRRRRRSGWLAASRAGRGAAGSGRRSAAIVGGDRRAAPSACWRSACWPGRCSARRRAAVAGGWSPGVRRWAARLASCCRRTGSRLAALAAAVAARPAASRWRPGRRRRACRRRRRCWSSPRLALERVDL